MNVPLLLYLQSYFPLVQTIVRPITQKNCACTSNVGPSSSRFSVTLVKHNFVIMFLLLDIIFKPCLGNWKRDHGKTQHRKIKILSF